MQVQLIPVQSGADASVGLLSALWLRQRLDANQVKFTLLAAFHSGCVHVQHAVSEKLQLDMLVVAKRFI